MNIFRLALLPDWRAGRSRGNGWVAACTAAAMLVLAAPLAGAAVPAPAPFRAVYLHPAPFDDTRVDPGLRAERMGKALDDIGACGFTTLLPYANTSGGQAYYPSKLLSPTGAPDGDTLGQLVREARKQAGRDASPPGARGLRVMPVVCVLVSGHDRPAGILEQHPEWALRKPDGTAMGWITPAQPEARAWLVRLVCELAGHLHPDGILLDYLRWPNEKMLLDVKSAEAFDHAAPAGETAEQRRERLQRFKEDALTALAGEISRALRAQQPGIQIGLYTWGPHVPKNHPVAQRWPDWVHDGYLDVVNVSGYCYRNNYGNDYLRTFEKRIRDSVDLVRQTGVDLPVSFALGIHTSHGALQSPGEIQDYLSIARREGCTGVAAFAWASLEKFVPDAAQAGWFREVSAASADKPQWRAKVTVDFGKDRGQNFGSLFEALDADGRVVAGAGFAGAYNSYYRADRHTLHCFVRPPRGVDTVQTAAFPRPSEACQHYLFDHAGTVFAATRSGDGRVLRWAGADGVWKATDPVQSPVLQVGRLRLELSANRITMDGREAFHFDSAKGSAGSYYYAQGILFFHVAEANSPERRTALHACPWDPETESAVALERCVVLPLAAPGEFPYSYGQLGGDVIAGSNNGGVYRFRNGAWSTLRAADPKVSFQLYAMINYRDRLLMGQYPTGELFEIEGDAVKQVAGWPPRPANATASAREAQTLTIYRGDLFAGVWPWGEVWRLKEQDQGWEFVGRLFRQPQVEPKTTAPYEAEMNALGEKVNNLWGQRVTALVPFREGLLASTSNKNGAALEDRLSFLAGGRGQEYGTVHRLYLPGNLAVPTVWTQGTTTFEVVITPCGLTVLQDDRCIGTDALPPGAMDGFAIDQIRWGEGVYGPLQGKRSGESLEKPEL